MTENTEPIRGKVARILNSRELALNIGTKDGVKLGMKFDVMDTKGENIEDPETGEVLGSLERPKVRVEINRIEERLSVARTFKSRKVNIGGGSGSIALDSVTQYLLPPNWVTEYETLKTEEKTWEDIDEEDSYVKSGDPVVQVLQDDDNRVLRRRKP